MKVCRRRRCRTVLVSYNEPYGLCFRHREEQRRVRFLRGIPGTDDLTAAERRRYVRGDAEQTNP